MDAFIDKFIDALLMLAILMFISTLVLIFSAWAMNSLFDYFHNREKRRSKK